MTNIIFLDIDGPLLPAKAYFHPKNKKTPWSFWDPFAIAMIEELRGDIDGRYVISSTWAIKGYERMKEILDEQGISTEFLHEDWATPRKMSSSRATEIEWWLDNHPEINKWIAIDDGVWNSSFEDEILQNGRVIEVDFDEGFSMKNYREALDFFGLGQPLFL